MFVVSLRASTVKFFTLIIAALVLLFGVVILSEGDTVYAAADGLEINYGGIKSNADRVSFISGFGLKVEENPISEDTVNIPDTLDRVLLGYNELQKAQGLDITKYRAKRVTRYTYRVTNYAAEGDTVVNLFIHRGKIIACDISGTEGGGFVLPLTEIDTSRLK